MHDFTCSRYVHVYMYMYMTLYAIIRCSDGWRDGYLNGCELVTTRVKQFAAMADGGLNFMWRALGPRVQIDKPRVGAQPRVVPRSIPQHTLSNTSLPPHDAVCQTQPSARPRAAQPRPPSGVPQPDSARLRVDISQPGLRVDRL